MTLKNSPVDYWRLLGFHTRNLEFKKISFKNALFICIQILTENFSKILFFILRVYFS